MKVFNRYADSSVRDRYLQLAVFSLHFTALLERAGAVVAVVIFTGGDSRKGLHHYPFIRLHRAGWGVLFFGLGFDGLLYNRISPIHFDAKGNIPFDGELDGVAEEVEDDLGEALFVPYEELRDVVKRFHSKIYTRALVHVRLEEGHRLGYLVMQIEPFVLFICLLG